MEIRPSTSETITSFVPVRPRRTGGRTPVTEVEGNFDCEDQSSDESSAHVDAANIVAYLHVQKRDVSRRLNGGYLILLFVQST